ncbi:GGDEF domain-containing protein [Bradyrhizobium sp. WSM 1704]|uniref:GGDEF domain-containing protein n=1 Tax=Bradyrhizobium semiaridum TaxID=2821404 RepID=UPI001CE37D35|nr:GGDEF domain-containing protein [Bradyrhizobium semiaridum]MCA6125350.1 GGDEF domain-containing protein [Bradyrhizobium semiaridum]
MGSAASSFLGPIAGALEGDRPRLTAERLARRARQRRQIQSMIGACFVLDAVVLLIYAHAGTTSVLVATGYALTGLTLVAVYVLLSELGVHERFRDHYLVAPQSAINMVNLLAFTYIAPEVGVLFLCNLFVVFGFGALRTSTRQTAIVWTVMVIGLAALFLGTDKPIGMPTGTRLDRLATMLVFALTIGRCMCLGIFSSSMQQSLYQSGLKLKEAYRRIEQLAEIDELTGAFNRRSIMRVLEEEIARSARSGSTTAVALIDLDHFKRINDVHGHPIGDEALRTFAISMFANIRSIDRFGRYGGEEFLLVLPDLSQDQAMRAVERLRGIIADLDWSAFSPGMKVTISAGVTTLKPRENSDTLLARADGALYAAKAGGRNRIAGA